MVEINNQRKAFLDMLAWSEGTDNGRRENQKSWLWRHCRRRLFTDYSDHPRKLVTLNPKLKSTGAGRYSFFPVGGMPTASSLAWKTSLPKSQDAVALQQIKERGALPMIDRGDIRQAIDRCSNIWASLPGAGYGRFRRKADSLIAKFKEAGGTVRRLMYEQDHALSPLWLSASSSACHGWLLIITVITPYLQSPARQKCQKTEAGGQRVAALNPSAWCCCARCKIHGDCFDAKAENDALRDDVAAGRRRLRIKAVCQSVREATTASGVDNQPPRLADTAERDYFTLRERLITYAKTTGRNPEVY